MSLLDRLADAHIEAAVERGDFDDLPGAGRPLPPDDARNVPQSLRAGYRMLKNAGCVPPEIAERGELRDVTDLLAQAVPYSVEARRLTRRARWLETRLAATERGRALLAEPQYAGAIGRRLMCDSQNAARPEDEPPS